MIPEEIKETNYFSFTDSIFTDLNFTPLQKSLIPGNCHLPIFEFAKYNMNYDNYWFIEDDVRFNGNWKTFFDNVDKIESDLLAANVRDIYRKEHLYTYSERSKTIIQWYWFNSIKHPKKFVNINDKIVSYNPIYRLSNNAIKYLFKELSDGWTGHNEILIATLLKMGG